MTIVVHLMGTVGVVHHGKPVDVGGPKQQAVLAVLALAAGCRVSTDRLVDLVWDENPPASARRTVQSYVASLRRALGESEALEPSQNGYTLDVDRAQVDLLAFEDQAVKLLADVGLDPDDKAQGLADMLSTWETPLDGLRGASRLADLTAPFEELRLQAVEGLATAQIAGTRAGDAVKILEALVREHPTRENLWLGLARALNRLGRRDAALSAVQRAREALREHLGVHPSALLAAFETDLLTGHAEPGARSDGGAEPGSGIHRIACEPDDAGPATPSLPPRLAAAQASNFVGRYSEYERLETAWKAVDDGDVGAGVMLMSGEPGIGKTTLSARFAADVHDQGDVVVYGRCDEDLGIPYKPWVEALTQLVAWLPDETLAAHIAERGGSIGRLIPGLARRLESGLPEFGDGDAQQFVLFACVADLLARAAEDCAVLVVLDDLHWADQATVQLLRHLATAGNPMRVAVLGTFRDSDIGPSHPLTDALAALHRDGRVERISLQGFGDDDLLALLEGIAGHEMTTDGVALRDAVLAETSGNPFFAVEVLRHLAETGAIYQGDDGRWTSTSDVRAAGLPISVTEVVGRRLAGLGGETERVLSLAAVIGRDFDVPLLARVADVDEDAVIELCDAAVSAAVLATADDPDGYTFAHALIARTLYDGLSPARRARAHRAVAKQLEALVGDDPGDRVGELAHHWMAATAPAEVAKVVRYAAAAGARALDQLAPDEALRWYGEALDLVQRHGSDDCQRVEILLGLGTAQHQCGVGDHRKTLLDAAWLADRIDAVDLLAQATLANSRGLVSAMGHTDEKRLAVIERALERTGATDLAVRAQLLGLAAVERLYADNLATRLALADEAVRTARRSGDPRALFRTLKFAMYVISAPSTLAQLSEWSDEASGLAEESGEPADRIGAAGTSAELALAEGNFAAFRSGTDAHDKLIDRVPSAYYRWRGQGWGVVSAILAGELGRAEQLAGETWAYGEQTGQPDAASCFGANLANIRSHQGRLHELTPQIAQALVDSPGLTAYRAVLANACASGGDLRRAAALLDEDRAGGLTLREDWQWTTAHAAWTIAAVLVGDTATAELLHARLQPHHDQVVATFATVQCAVAHYLGMLDHLLGRHDDADRWFDEAMTIHDGMESPLLIAYTEAAWSALLADRDRADDRQRARAMAERAITVATAGAYGNIQSDAQAVLARLH